MGKNNIEKGKKKTIIAVIGVPIELKNHFNAYCVKRGKSMSKVFREYAKQCVMEDLK